MRGFCGQDSRRFSSGGFLSYWTDFAGTIFAFLLCLTSSLETSFKTACCQTNHHVCFGSSSALLRGRMSHVACQRLGKNPAAWKAVRDGGAAQRCLPHECHAYITWKRWSRISTSIAFADVVVQWPRGERPSCSQCVMATTFPWPLSSTGIARLHDCIVDWILRS